MTGLAAGQYRYDSCFALIEDYHARGWTDGLPVVPPTPELVEQFLLSAGLTADEVLGTVPTREVVVTAEKVAINAVMAGCRSDYAPVVACAVRAHLREKANCHGTTGTLSGAAQTVIVNGPIRHELDVNCKAGCFGPGWRANAAIGRALRLVVRNVCRAVPHELDRASFSTPARYSFCFGEDEESSPWLPLHVERGFAPGESTVTVHSTMLTARAGDARSRTPEGIVDTLGRVIREVGTVGDRWLGDETNVVVVVGPEHRRHICDAGWSKADVRSYLWSRLSEAGPQGDRPVMIGRPEGLLLVAAGGPGVAESWILFPHLALAITEPVVRPAGDNLSQNQE